jgi:hypothetical protein
MKNALALLSAAFLTLPLAALAQSQNELVQRYTALAGSEHNAISLVNGLREGYTVSLARFPWNAMFIPPTGKMVNVNVDHALAIAQATLAKHGITEPAPLELALVLMGGNLATPGSGTVAVEGVLRLRAQGKGWPRVAQEHGVKAVDAKRAEKKPTPKPAAAPVRVAYR